MHENPFNSKDAPTWKLRSVLFISCMDLGNCLDEKRILL